MEIQKSQELDVEEVRLEHELICACINDQREKQEDSRDKITLKEDKKKKVS